jgi:hypothetical protein
MLQNAISGAKRRARLCLEQNGEHFQHLIIIINGGRGGSKKLFPQ